MMTPIIPISHTFQCELGNRGTPRQPRPLTPTPQMRSTVNGQRHRAQTEPTGVCVIRSVDPEPLQSIVKVDDDRDPI
jgi:hypothetical protein